jgi:hypothetical protein
MRLYNQYGTFDLPDGFALNLERTNPFFTDEGDTSVPVTLPSSPHNLQLLRHIERIDAKDSDMAMAEAWLTVGAVTVKGTLLVDTISKEDGIDAAFTFRNGGLYAEYRDKPLKELFADTVVDLGSPREAAQHLYGIYEAGSNTNDYTCFPVMGQEEEACREGYTIINDLPHFTDNPPAYGERVFYEGGTMLYVPEGYGVTPFIYLHRMLDLMFELMNYEVTVNVFENFTRKLVVLNNTVDAIVNGTICYADMVPDMTVSELLNWLRDRFMVQAVVDSNTMTVKIVQFDALTKPDADITGLLLGGITMRYEKPSHVVITPSVGAGNEAAATSLKALKEKYGAWVGVDENDWGKIVNNTSPNYYDCLILRRSTGMFSEMRRNLVTGDPVLEPVGSNCFAYDRENNEQTEAFNPNDTIPLMVCGSKLELYPVIGDPIHRHSTYSGMSDNDDQRLIIVQEYSGINYTAFKRGGTTQDNVPVLVQTSHGHLSQLGRNLTPDGLYPSFWALYNNILLGGKKTATMRVGYDTPTFLTANMASGKLCRNQLLLPVKTSAEAGEKMRNGVSEFLVARFDESLADAAITPASITRLRWVMQGTPVQDEIDGLNVTPGAMAGPYFDENFNETNVPNNDTWCAWNVISQTVKADIVGGNDVFLGPPASANLTVSFAVRVNLSCKYHCKKYGDLTQATTIEYSKEKLVTVTFISQTY